MPMTKAEIDELEYVPLESRWKSVAGKPDYTNKLADVTPTDIKPAKRVGHHPQSTIKTKFSEQERQFIKARMARLYLQGKPIIEIAHELGISEPTAGTYLREISQAWRESANVDFSLQRAIELEKLDQLEATFWEAWQKSLEDVTKTQLDAEPDASDTGGKMKPRRQRVTRTGSTGNPAFLDGVYKCIDRRIKLLGIDAAERYVLESRGQTGGNDLEQRLSKYDGVFAIGLVGVASPAIDGDRLGESVDSERPASEASGILDADYTVGKGD
jgi:hypothetical protein